MAVEDTSWDLQVFYSVTRAADIDILEEGLYAQDRYRTPTDALGDLSQFIRKHGGPDYWDEADQYEVGSCWLRHCPDTEIAYQARLERVTSIDDDWPRSPPTRTPAMLTWKRLSAAGPGFKRRNLTDE